MEPLELEKNLSNMPLILGLLRDWVILIQVYVFLPCIYSDLN